MFALQANLGHAAGEGHPTAAAPARPPTTSTMMRVPAAVTPLLAPLLLLLAPCRAHAQIPMDEAEKERRRMPRPAEIPAPAGAGALPLDSLRAGMRVVVSARGLATRRQAIVVALPARDTLVVDGVVDRLLLRVPVDRVTVLDVSTGLAGTTQSRLASTGIGLAAGLAAGALLGNGDSGSFLDAGTVTGTLAGGVIGLAVGWGRRGHAWRPVAVGR